MKISSVRAVIVGGLATGVLLFFFLVSALGANIPSRVNAASGETSDNCEVFATINGVDKYRCDDWDYGVVCYGEVNGMMWCLPKL